MQELKVKCLLLRNVNHLRTMPAVTCYDAWGRFA